ncbi:MAG TPA: hypothetical protein VGC91_05945 [Pyrinomonadaceae bacterium]|jgi:hypothetical protein
MKNRARMIYASLATLSQKRIARKIPVGLFVIFALIIVASSGKENLGQNKASSQVEFPRGDWSVGSHPFLGTDSESTPVIVTSVTTDAKRGIAVTKVGLENLSKENVTAVKLTWRVSTEQASDKVLLQGQTPFITRDGGLPAGISLVLRFPVVTFAKIYQPLVKNGTLDGEFRIDISVSEILYEDGSKWASSDSSQAKSFRASNHASAPAPQGTCGRQSCETRTSPSGNVFYACRASNSNERCSVSDDGFSCTNISCTRPHPDGDYEGYEMILPYHLTSRTSRCVAVNNRRGGHV